MSRVSSAPTRRFWYGLSVTKMRQLTSQTKPSTPITTKDTRQPNASATSPTTGPAIALPSVWPENVKPIIVAVSWRGNQFEMVRLVFELIGPSPIPKNTRQTSSETKPVANEGSPQQHDQIPMAQEKTRIVPNLSEK